MTDETTSHVDRPAGRLRGWGLPARRLAAEARAQGIVATAQELPRFARDLRRFRKLGGRADTRYLYPALTDRTAAHPVEPQYLHQGVWLLKQVALRRPQEHVDVASHLPTVAMLTVLTSVTFVDIRLSGLQLDGLIEQHGSATSLPYADASVHSISCLHVAEHVGLGRYGDDLDPEGSEKVARELARVVAPGGTLYLSVPVGRPRVEFNAHRVFAVEAVPNLLPGLELQSFALVDSSGRFHPDAEPKTPAGSGLALGLFTLTRR